MKMKKLALIKLGLGLFALFTSLTTSGCIYLYTAAAGVGGAAAGAAAGEVITKPGLTVAKLSKKNYFKIKFGSVSRQIDGKDDYLVLGYDYQLNYTQGKKYPFNVVVKAKPAGTPDDNYKVIYKATVYFENGWQGGVFEIDVPKEFRSHKTLDVAVVITPQESIFNQGEYVYKDTVTAGVSEYKID